MLIIAIGMAVTLLSFVVFRRNESACSPIQLAAAVSLKPPLDELAQSFEKSHPAWCILATFGSSGSLQQQVEHGAPVDVLAFAAEKPLEALAKAGLIAEASRRNLAGNELVLAVPANASTAIATFSDLRKDSVRRIAIGEPRAVPLGTYAIETLTSLGLLDAVAAKLVHAASARHVLTHIESANVDAGLVYASDAKASSAVRIVAKASSAWHMPIVYPAALTQRGQATDGAPQFLDFLSSAKARGVFSRHGLTSPDEPAP